MWAYAEYRLWWVGVDIIKFARQLGVDMVVPLGSYRNVREALEMLDVIESTRFELLPSSWSERTPRDIDYHRGRRGPGGDFFY